MDWPSQSPDLNPIEILWSILDKRCRDRRPNNEVELFQILQDAWRALPVSLLDDLVTSMPRRCQAVIDAEGRATKYYFPHLRTIWIFRIIGDKMKCFKVFIVML